MAGHSTTVEMTSRGWASSHAGHFRSERSQKEWLPWMPLTPKLHLVAKELNHE